MNSSDYKITLDIHSMSAPISLNVKKGDTGRRICIGLTENGVPYKIKPGCYAVFTGKKPDEKILWNSCIIEGDTIIYEITEQTTNVVGWLPVQIRLYGAGGKLISSPDFVLIVDGVTVEDDELVSVSENEVTALTELITDFTVLGQEAPLNVNIEDIASGADKTYAEIREAYEARRTVLLHNHGQIFVLDEFGPTDPSKMYFKFYPVITAATTRVPYEGYRVDKDDVWSEFDTGYKYMSESKVLDLIQENAPEGITEEEVVSLINENAPTPNWNASEGEPGYIENRTHYFEVFAERLEGEYNWTENITGIYTEMPVVAEVGYIRGGSGNKPTNFSIEGWWGNNYEDLEFDKVFTLPGPNFNMAFEVVQIGQYDYLIRAYSSNSGGFYGQTPALYNICRTNTIPTKYLPMDAIMAEIEARYTNVAEVGA